MRSDKDFVQLECAGDSAEMGLLVLPPPLLLLLLRQCVHYVVLSMLLTVTDITNSSQVTVVGLSFIIIENTVCIRSDLQQPSVLWKYF